MLATMIASESRRTARPRRRPRSRRGWSATGSRPARASTPRLARATTAPRTPPPPQPDLRAPTPGRGRPCAAPTRQAPAQPEPLPRVPVSTSSPTPLHPEIQRQHSQAGSALGLARQELREAPAASAARSGDPRWRCRCNRLALSLFTSAWSWTAQERQVGSQVPLLRLTDQRPHIRTCFNAARHSVRFLLILLTSRSSTCDASAGLPFRLQFRRDLTRLPFLVPGPVQRLVVMTPVDVSDGLVHPRVAEVERQPHRRFAVAGGGRAMAISWASRSVFGSAFRTITPLRAGFQQRR